MLAVVWERGMDELEKRSTQLAVRAMPRWVKAFVWAGIVAIILVAFMLTTGHGPWQHMGMAGMHG